MGIFFAENWFRLLELLKLLELLELLGFDAVIEILILVLLPPR